MNESMKKWEIKWEETHVWEEFLDSAFDFCYLTLSYLSVIIIRQAVLQWEAAALSSEAMWTLEGAEGIQIRTKHTAVLSELLQHLCLTSPVEQETI